MNDYQTSEFQFDGADRRLAVFSYLLGLLFLALFIPFRLGVNVPIFVICVYAAAFHYQKISGAPVDGGSTSLFLIVMIASLPFVLYDATPFRIVHFILLMGAIVFQLFTMFSCRAYPRLSENWLFDLANAVIFTPLANLDAFFRVLLRRVLTTRLRGVLPVIAGLAVALPLLILLGTQLTSADAAFELLRTRLSLPFWRVLRDVLLGLLAAIPIAMWIFGMFFGFRHRRRIDLLQRPADERLHILPGEAIIGALVPICLLQAAYLASQVIYFVSTFSGLLPEDFSYAEYARRGFLELSAVALLNMIVISIVLAFSKHKKRAAEKTVNALVIFLCVCSILMIATVFAKVVLYMRSFGLTANRIITAWVMLGLVLVFVFTILRCLRPSFPLIRAVTVTGIVMFLMLCFVDCDYIAVGYNKDAYLSGRLEGFDVGLLQQSSDSVVPLIIDLCEQADGELKEDSLALLARYAERRDDSFWSWRSFNISRYNARSAFLRWQEETGFDPRQPDTP